MVGEVFAQGRNQIFQIEGGPNVKVEEGVIEKLILIEYNSDFFFGLGVLGISMARFTPGIKVLCDPIKSGQLRNIAVYIWY